MKCIATQGGLSQTNKKFTNHSVRKTTVRKLQKAGISNDKIAAITGHRNEQSLRAYSNADSDDHQGISGILSNTITNIHSHNNEVPELLYLEGRGEGCSVIKTCRNAW